MDRMDRMDRIKTDRTARISLDWRWRWRRCPDMARPRFWTFSKANGMFYMACPHSFKIPPRKKQFYRAQA